VSWWDGALLQMHL